MVSVFTGPNTYALKDALNKRIDEFEKKNGYLSVEKYDGEEVELHKIKAALESTSLFSSNKLVVVRSLSANKDAEEAETLFDVLSDSDEAELLLVETKPDKRSSFYKSLKKLYDVTEFPEMDEPVLVNWMIKQAEGRSVKLTKSDAQYLINRVGNQQSKVNNELQKLFDYTKQINKKTIDEICESIPQNTIFELLEAVFSGHQKRTIELYDNLRVGGSHPPIILSMLIWQLHLISLMAFAGSKSVEQVAADSGSKPYPLRKSQAIARQLGKDKIIKLFNELEELDYKLKTQSIVADEALRNLLSKIAISSK